MHIGDTFMICPSCNFENLPGADTCESCATDLAMGETRTSGSAGGARDPLAGSVTRHAISSVPAPPMVVVEPTATTGEVVDRLIQADTGCALVVYQGKALIGIVSERDLMLKVAHRFDELEHTPIRDFMTPAPESLPPDATVAWALNRMDLGGFRHIPIEDNGRPIAVVSVRHILKYLIDHYAPVRSA